MIAGLIRIKDGTKLHDLRPQMALVFVNVSAVYGYYGYEARITSGNDSGHSFTSLHWSGAGLDFGTKEIERDDLDLIVNAISDSLGEDYDCILEFRDEDNEHLHIEYQPKGG